ncbi:DUF397 domain-containing protein [Streptomyces flavofungini]|uniref:DUF397 domain-containing protein n=1 Tax=Streptomyces flavofungini TaxID=68200 RepID=UPI0025AFB3B7|nr:DUF397 domain-containing protein [Streptomyces flavofungini]WJV48664.1 DUF397 domain-containing protein [Streptomyces flavofungini]
MAQVTHWQKSTFSDGSDGDHCVEVATSPGTIHLRESDDPSIQLTTTPASLARLLHHLRTTEG